MKIKKFTAESMRDALFNIKKELGPQAVILKTKKIKPNGIFSKEYFEVTAAIDIDEKEVIETEKLTNSLNKNSKFESNYFVFEEQKAPPSNINLNDKDEYITFSLHHDEKISALQKILYKKDVLAKNIIKITENILNFYNENTEFIELVEKTREILLKNIRVSGQLILKRNKPTVIALIGPTGVGKTTTIAKLATNFSLFGKLNIGLITSDTYRVAAVEQLKTFAKIINIPIETIYKPNEIKDAIEKFYDKNIIFIDTAGRSQNDKEKIIQLQDLLYYAEPDEVHLVLSATTKYQDTLDIIKKFAVVPIHKLIFTKLDETTNFGMIYNIQQVVQKKISYFTTGQNIPEDIEIAKPEIIVNNLLGDIDVYSGE